MRFSLFLPREESGQPKVTGSKVNAVLEAAWRAISRISAAVSTESCEKNKSLRQGRHLLYTLNAIFWDQEAKERLKV